MRSAPVAQRGKMPEAPEFRVRFSRRLRGARIVSAAEIAPPPVAPAPPPPAPPVAVPPPPAPTGFVQADITNELRADRARIEAVLGSVQAAVENLHTERAARLGELQQVAVAMALSIATRLLHEQIESGAFAIENKVRDMIAQLGGDAAVTVRLNPADLALLSTRLGGQPLSDEYADPRFVADANLGRGDCQVEGRESMLLSDVTRELEEIRDDLLRRMKNARS